jgi:hypothetical protein
MTNHKMKIINKLLINDIASKSKNNNTHALTNSNGSNLVASNKDYFTRTKPNIRQSVGL